jgi:hypothetical protein
MSALFEAQVTEERVLHLRECAEYVFAHRGLYNTGDFESCADILITSYWLHVELVKNI